MNNKFIKWAGCLATILAMTACSSEDVTDSNQLPEGMYPLEISSVTMTAESTAQPWGANAPQTRVSENTTDNGKSSVWTNGDIIGVKMGTTTGEYSMTVANDKVTAITPVEGKAVYWQNKTSQTINGWYPVNGEVAIRIVSVEI